MPLIGTFGGGSSRALGLASLARGFTISFSPGPGAVFREGPTHYSLDIQASGTLQISGGNTDIDFILIGGGGSGGKTTPGSGNLYGSGGGGAGGVLTVETYSVSPGSYPIVIGASDSPTTAFDYEALAGGSRNVLPSPASGVAGGSGSGGSSSFGLALGGASLPTPAPQGYAGGNAGPAYQQYLPNAPKPPYPYIWYGGAGGGGGAGSVGSNGGATVPLGPVPPTSNRRGGAGGTGGLGVDLAPWFRPGGWPPVVGLRVAGGGGGSPGGTPYPTSSVPGLDGGGRSAAGVFPAPSYTAAGDGESNTGAGGGGGRAGLTGGSGGSGRMLLKWVK